MEPISILITALVAGASVVGKTTVEESVKDAYKSVKNLIKKKYKKVNVDILDVNPTSSERQKVLRENLQNDTYSVTKNYLRK